MSTSKQSKSKPHPKSRRGRRPGQKPNPALKAASTVRRVLLTRAQAGHTLGGVSVSTIIRLEREKRLTPIKLHKDAPTAQTFYRADQVEALAAEPASTVPFRRGDERR